MQSRRDQVQAYFFVVGRMVAAVTHGRPDVLAAAPNRRLTTGTAVGVLLAALIAGIFGIYGLFVPGGSTSWRQPGTIVMDRASGARFLYLDGQLRPVLNYSSARLVAGSGGRVVPVAQDSLAGTPIGRPIGIPGAPDALPEARRLDRGAWTVCAGAPSPGPGTAPTAPGDGPAAVVLLLGRPAPPPPPPEQAMLVTTPDGVAHLLWQGRRHRIADASVVQALGYGDLAPVQVGESWLNPVPTGRDLAPPDLLGAGRPGPLVDGRPSRVGQVYEVRNPALDAGELYLVRPDGVAALSRTGAALALASAEARAAYPDTTAAPIEVGPAALAGVPRSTGPDLVGGLPEVPPRVVVPPRGSVPCARYDPSAEGEVEPVLSMQPAAEVEAGTVPVAPHVAGTMADRVSVPVGTGVVARERPAPGATPGTAFLVTDTGMRFPLPDDRVMNALGYGEPDVVAVPGQLLRLLPTGPVLDPADALLGDRP